jgi:hypothetical protein
VKVIVTDERVEIYSEDMPVSECPGDSCREFAMWAMQWAIRRLGEETIKSIAEPGTQNSVLCD